MRGLKRFVGVFPWGKLVGADDSLVPFFVCSGRDTTKTRKLNNLRVPRLRLRGLRHLKKERFDAFFVFLRF